MKVYVLLGCQSSLGKLRVIYAGVSAAECSVYYNSMVNDHYGQIIIEVWINGLLSNEEDEEFMQYI